MIVQKNKIDIADVRVLYDFAYDMEEAFDIGEAEEDSINMLTSLIENKEFETILNSMIEDNYFAAECILTFYGYVPSWLERGSIEYTYDDFAQGTVYNEFNPLCEYLKNRVITLIFPNGDWEVSHDFEELQELIFEHFNNFRDVLIEPLRDVIEVYTAHAYGIEFGIIN